MIKALRTGSGHRRVGAGVALLAMVMQIIVQVWHAPLIPAGTMAVDGDVPMIAICTVDGIEWVPFTALFGESAAEPEVESDPSGASDSHDRPPGPGAAFCPICISLALSVLTVAILWLVLLPARRIDGPVRGGTPVVSPLSVHAPASRGPPVLA